MDYIITYFRVPNPNYNCTDGNGLCTFILAFAFHYSLGVSPTSGEIQGWVCFKLETIMYQYYCSRKTQVVYVETKFLSWACAVYKHTSDQVYCSYENF